MSRRLLVWLALVLAPIHEARSEPISAFLTVTVTVSAQYAAIATMIASAWNAAVLSFALGTVSRSLFGKKSGAGALITQNAAVRSTTAPRELVYGQVRKSGVVLFQATSGVNNKYLWTVLVIAGHQCEDMTDVWLDSVKIDDANINPSTGAVTQGDFTGHLNIWRLLGDDAQVAQPDLDFSFSQVTSAHRGQGLAMLVIRQDRDNDAFPTGPFRDAFVLTKGRRLYDPRKDSTNGGSGSHRLDDATTWEWSDNSELCASDYVTGGSIVFDVATPDNRLGMRSLRINWDRVISGANKCDELVAIPGSTTEKRYRTAAVLSCADTHETNLDVLLAPMGGNRVFTGGAYQIYPGEYEVPTETVSDDDLGSEGYKVVGALSAPDRYNQVSGLYFDPAREYQYLPSFPRTDAAFEAEDGKPILRTVEQRGVPGEYQSQRLCEIIKQQSRNQISVDLNCKFSALRVSPWETFYLALQEMGWVAEVFRAMAMEIDLVARRVKITGRQESAAAYADLTAGEYSVAGSATASKQMEAPDPVSGFTATSTPAGIRFQATLPTYITATTVVEVYEHTSATPFSSANKVAEFTGSLYVLPRRDTTTRYYWLKLLDRRTKQASVEYPTSTSGVAGVADLSQTTDIAPNAVTEVYNDYVSSLSSTPFNLSVTSRSISEPGTYEILTTAQITVDTFGVSDYVLVDARCASGSGTMSPTNSPTHRVTAAGQVITVTTAQTFITSGSGPWDIRGRLLDMGGGSYYTAANWNTRVTVILR